MKCAAQHVARGRALLVPSSEAIAGHGTHTRAAVWKGELQRFLEELERAGAAAAASAGFAGGR